MVFPFLLDSVKTGLLETGPQMHKDFLGKKVCLSAGCVSGDGRSGERGREGVKTSQCTHTCTQTLTVWVFLHKKLCMLP